ncbi:MAG: Nif3-like dinuclear metal center hexameric protein [Clostridia bacterium]|nr:Nif3-like dinuclear metal center hexameric protein [Clostridia bacterium]MBQ4158411.1 Nif3-like dinuclear metal center hexameric protein [Clostridia bacterium]
MTAKVKDVFHWVNDIAPFETAEKWDNSGLLMGKKDNEVTNIICALDVNERVIEEAEKLNANTIVSHHPIMFSGRKNLREDDAEGRLLCRLVRGGYNVISAHTNYDKALGGVNDCLAQALGIDNPEKIEGDEEEIVRIGNIAPVTLDEFSKNVEKALGDVVRVYGDRNKMIRRVAVCGGSGGEYAYMALRAGADAYVTGEMRYHDSIDLSWEGLSTLHAGHDATERIAIKPLANGLQNRADALQYNLKVFLVSMGVVE